MAVCSLDRARARQSDDFYSKAAFSTDYAANILDEWRDGTRYLTSVARRSEGRFAAGCAARISMSGSPSIRQPLRGVSRQTLRPGHLVAKDPRGNISRANFFRTERSRIRTRLRGAYCKWPPSRSRLRFSKWRSRRQTSRHMPAANG